MNAMKTALIRVLVFLMHKNPHLDEVLGRLLIALYGTERFTGADTAETWFLDEDIEGTNREFDRDGKVPIGTILGTRFNEHCQGDERIPGECATTLIAKFLRVMRLKELQDIIATTLYFDTHGHCPKTHAAELTKAANRVYPGDSKGVMLNVTTLIESLITVKRFKLAAVAGEQTLVQAYELWKGKEPEKYNDSDVLAHMDELVKESMEQAAQTDSCHCVAELAYLLTMLYRRFSAEDVTKIIAYWFEVMYRDQVNFQAKLTELKPQIKFNPVQALLHPDRRSRKEISRKLKLAVFYDDSPYGTKVARYLGAELTLQVSPTTGNMLIMAVPTIEALSLANPAKMIRALELPEAERFRTDWAGLSVPGKYPGVRNWYYSRKLRMLANGNLTHGAVATKIPIGDVVDVLQHAFHWEGVNVWCRRHNVLVIGNVVRRRSSVRRPSSDAPVAAAPAPEKAASAPKRAESLPKRARTVAPAKPTKQDRPVKAEEPVRRRIIPDKVPIELVPRDSRNGASKKPTNGAVAGNDIRSALEKFEVIAAVKPKPPVKPEAKAPSIKLDPKAKKVSPKREAKRQGKEKSKAKERIEEAGEGVAPKGRKAKSKSKPRREEVLD